MKDFALGLALKQRRKATQKSPIKHWSAHLHNQCSPLDFNDWKEINMSKVELYSLLCTTMEESQGQISIIMVKAT